MKHYKSVNISSNFRNVKYPCANLKTVLVFKPHIFSPDSLVAFDSYESENVTDARIANLTVTTIWVRFT